VKPYFENTCHKNRAGGVAQGVGPEFKPQNSQKKKKKNPKQIKDLNVRPLWGNT
jgi:hypothetical protein